MFLGKPVPAAPAALAARDDPLASTEPAAAAMAGHVAEPTVPALAAAHDSLPGSSSAPTPTAAPESESLFDKVMKDK